MSKVLDTTWGILQSLRNFSFLDDLEDVTSGGKYTNTNTGTGAALAAVNGAGTLGGQATLTTGTTTGNLSARALTNPVFVPVQDVPMYFRTRFKFTEANTNQANVYAGFSSAFPADTLQSANSGPLANFSGFGFYKAGGSTTWSIIVSNGTTQQTLLLTSANLMGQGDPRITQTSGLGAWTLLEVIVENITATACDVLFKINGVLVHKYIGVVWTSMAAMSAGVEMKAGSTATVTEVLTLDYFCGQQQRFAQEF